LVRTFMKQFVRENGLREKPVDAEVFIELAKRPWPGNIRELKNVVERMTILSGPRVTVADLPEDPHASPFEEDPEPSIAQPNVAGPEGFLTLRAHREVAERQYLLEALRAMEWNISRAAVVLGVERTNLHKKIRGHGIRRGE
jgi:two-component system, NtrC family, nitrogen regulation response regulator NtrX